jgi:hypothetical protein
MNGYHVCVFDACLVFTFRQFVFFVCFLHQVSLLNLLSFKRTSLHIIVPACLHVSKLIVNKKLSDYNKLVPLVCLFSVLLKDIS